MSNNAQLDWDDLRFFLAVCRAGSVNQASADLRVSHTTVLRRIKAFETHLGARLFDRTRSGYAMTDAAAALLQHAEAMEAEVAALQRRVDGLDQRLAGTVRITAPAEIAAHFLVPALPAFRQSYPGIDIVLMETMTKLDLDAREADLAVRVSTRPPEALIGRKVHPVVQAVYGLSDDTPTGVILYREERPGGWTAGFPEATVALRTDSPTTMLQAVLAGVGVARLPCYLAALEPRLLQLGPLLDPEDWGIWVLTHPDVRSSARVGAARTFVIDVLRRNSTVFLGTV